MTTTYAHGDQSRTTVEVAIMRRLPEPLPMPAGQTTLQRGLVIFAFVLAENVTATVSDQDLEYADHAATYAAAVRPAYMSDDWHERVNRTAHTIRVVLRARAATRVVEVPSVPEVPDGRIVPGGYRVPVGPGPVPTLPPAGVARRVQAVDIPF